MNVKRLFSALLSAAMILGCFAGCGKSKNAKDDEITLTPTISTTATGRYVEKELHLPESRRALDMVMLSDGQLRVALQEDDGNILLATTSDDRSDWADTVTLPAEITSGVEMETVALSPDGSVFCSTMESLEDDTHQPHLWVIDPAGNPKELPNTYKDIDPDAGYFIPYADFTEDGSLIAQIYVGEIRQIYLTTGEMSDDFNGKMRVLYRIGCAGSDTFLLSMETVAWYHDGESQDLPEVLKAHLESALAADYGNTPKIVFWENAEGYLFFTTCDGLYSYIPGGSVTEELIPGSRTTLGDPTSVPVALTGCDDGSFYLLTNVSSTPTLCQFVYDEEAPTVGNTQLRIYSLYEDDDLTQMVTQYQKANANVTVTLEIGLTGDSGITESDAIRTLNTEILAGNGPDLICLDGFNLESYLEKGVLADVSHILDAGYPLFRNITDCYAQDGKICAVPTTFTISAIYGKEEYVSQIHDLDSLVAVAKQAREDFPAEIRVVNGMYPDILADYYYDSCSAAWMNADGTLNADKLTEFYAAMTELYALEEGFRQEYAEWMAEVRAEYVSGNKWVNPGEYTGIAGAQSILSDIAQLSAGTLDGMNTYAYALAGQKEYLDDSYIMRPLDGQASNVFLPRRIMGILTSAKNPQAAESFLTFMLSNGVQDKDLTTGFPVNRVSLQRQLSEERVLDYWIGNGEVAYQAQWPNEKQRQKVGRWIENLTTPANTNRTIRNMVMEPLWDCCNGNITPGQAANQTLQALNLYLSE